MRYRRCRSVQRGKARGKARRQRAGGYPIACSGRSTERVQFTASLPTIAFFGISGKKVSFAAALGWVRKSSIWTSRAFAWTLIAAALLCASVVLSLRYWFLPHIESYRDDIAAAISRAVDLHVTIGRISADWDGMRPHLKLERVVVYDRSGKPALDLDRVESTIAWRSLAALELHFEALDVYRPALEVRRDAHGKLSIAGIELAIDERRHSGFAEWLLDQ